MAKKAAKKKSPKGKKKTGAGKRSCLYPSNKATTKTGKAGHYKPRYELISVDGAHPAKGGKHCGYGPQSVASRLLSRYCNSIGTPGCKNIQICVRKITKGRNKDTVYCYTGSRTALSKAAAKKASRGGVARKYTNTLGRVSKEYGGKPKKAKKAVKAKAGKAKAGKAKAGKAKAAGAGSRKITSAALKVKDLAQLKRMAIRRKISTKDATKSALISAILSHQKSKKGSNGYNGGYNGKKKKVQHEYMEEEEEDMD